MTSPISIRLFEEDLAFIKLFSKEKGVNQTKTIQEFIHQGVKETKIKKAVQDYKDGKKTIRDCMLFLDMNYREILNEFAKRNLIGGDPKLQESMIKDTLQYLG